MENNLHLIIRQKRLNLGYESAENFAYDKGFNRSSYQRWEQGKEIKMNSFIRIAKALKMKPSELLKQAGL